MILVLLPKWHKINAQKAPGSMASGIPVVLFRPLSKSRQRHSLRPFQDNQLLIQDLKVRREIQAHSETDKHVETQKLRKGIAS